MRSKILIVLLYLWIICNSSFSSSADLQENKAENEVQIKEGHGAGGHGGSGGSHGGAAGGGSGSGSSGGQQGVGVIPHNAGGGAQDLRSNHHRVVGSSSKMYAGYLTMAAILLAILLNTTI